VKTSEFKRWLEAQGAVFTPGGSHYKVTLGTKRSTCPRHLSKEIKEGTRQAILKQLGLK